MTSVLYSCKGTEDRETPVALKIVTFGGTVTEGTSAKLDVFHDCFQYGTTTVNKVRDTQTWWAISERILRDWVDGGVEVISAGSAGNTASRGVGRLEDDVLSHSPDLVLVMFGMDDALAGVEADNFREDLKKIVNRIEEEKVNVVLMTPPPISERMTINYTMDELRQRQAHLSGLVQAIRDLAEEKSLSLIDFHQFFLDNRLAYDHLFEGWLPDAVAQSAMAPFVAGELLPVMGVNDYPNPILSDYRNVYSDNKNHEGRHNGFTDLAYFQGEFYLAFRTGTYHGSGASGEGGGKTIVLRSADGITWDEDGVFEVKGFIDTRDPKFLQIEDRLVLYVISWPDVSQPDKTSVVYGFERLGKGRWSEPLNCASYIFWRPRKWQDKYVVAGYEWKIDEQQKWNFRVVLHQSSNGLDWEKISTIVDYGMDANETDLFVENDKLVAYSRTEESGNNEMLISTYIPDENRWETVTSGRMIHAPCVFLDKKRKFIIGRYCSQSEERFKELQVDWKKFTRYGKNPVEEGYQTVAEATGVDPVRVEEYHHGLRTGMFMMDGTKPRLVMELLSAGDSSYPGVVQYGDEYVISDYSMHEYYPVIRKSRDWETPSDIYVSRIRFGE